MISTFNRDTIWRMPWYSTKPHLREGLLMLQCTSVRYGKHCYPLIYHYPLSLQLIDLAKKARDHGNTYQFGESSIVTVWSCHVCVCVIAINRCSGRWPGCWQAWPWWSSSCGFSGDWRRSSIQVRVGFIISPFSCFILLSCCAVTLTWHQVGCL